MTTGILIALALAAPPSPSPTSPPEAAGVHKSVRGTLESIDHRLGRVIMKADGGAHLTWRFSKAVLAQAEKAKTGAPMIVIYRQTAANEKRVTALAFPGTAERQVYVNLTGAPVLLRSGGAVGETCGMEAGPITESGIPDGGRAEIKDACWCCAPSKGTCTPSTRSGKGEAFLVNCFESDPSAPNRQK